MEPVLTDPQLDFYATDAYCKHYWNLEDVVTGNQDISRHASVRSDRGRLSTGGNDADGIIPINFVGLMLLAIGCGPFLCKVVRLFERMWELESTLSVTCGRNRQIEVLW